MRTSLLVSILSIFVTACHRELGHSYQDQVPIRVSGNPTSHIGFLEFNEIDSTFYRYTPTSTDTIFGSYSIVGNQLYLTELGKDFRCDSIENIDSNLFIFLYKFNSSPAVNYPVEINGQFYYTDSLGMLENYNFHPVKDYIFLRPVLMKTFRIPSDCKRAVFYMEPMHVSNPDFLQYTIRRKSIRSKDGNNYKKTTDRTKRKSN